MAVQATKDEDRQTRPESNWDTTAPYRASNLLDTTHGVICVRRRKIAGEWQNFPLVPCNTNHLSVRHAPKLRPDLITEGSLSRRPARLGRCCWSWRFATAATLTASIHF